jgi:thiazole synthase
MDSKLNIKGIEFSSRLWVGTGKYKDYEQTALALEASGTDLVTVAVRRVNITDSKSENLLDHLDMKKYKILPNTAGCYTVEDAIRYARLAREAGVSDLIKLEVIGDEKTLFPDVCGTLKATEILAKEGFIVLPYTLDDPISAQRLVDAGASAVMPLGAPIGSGLGIRNPYNIKIIQEVVDVPVIVDAGVGTASDVTIAMELGCDAVLINTGIAGADDPIMMASAMKHAVLAGRQAYKAGRIPRKLYATASSPIEGMII